MKHTRAEAETACNHTSLAMTVEEFCQSARISRRTFYVLMERQAGPPTVAIGRRRVIRRQAAEAWLQARETA